MPFLKNNQKGFTLVELLVVISVIGILAGVITTVVNTGSFRERGWDAQRKADLGKIQTALELYFADYGEYPLGSWIQLRGSDAVSQTLISGGYLSDVPQDPEYLDTTPNGGPLSNPELHRYNYFSDRTQYILTAIMSDVDSNDDGSCIDVPVWSVFFSAYSEPGSFTTEDYCYGVQSP